MPGRPCPSRNSKDAPPPVEICVMAWLQSVRPAPRWYHRHPPQSCPYRLPQPAPFRRSPAKWRHFEDTHRTVPDHGARGVQHLAKTSDSRHANIQTLPTGRNAPIRHHPRRDVGLNVLGNHVITRQETLYPAFGGFGENIAGHGETVGLDQGITHRIALYLRQSRAMPPPMSRAETFSRRFIMSGIFVGDFGTSQNGHQAAPDGRSPC